MSEKKHTVEITEDQENMNCEATPDQPEAKGSMPCDGQTESVEQSDLETHLATAEAQAKDYYDRLLRVSAEFENYKKRTSREMQEVVKYANEKLAKEILTVVDNLERAIASAAERSPKDDPLLQGVHLTLEEILKILDRHHVKPIDSLGEPFDPTYHQAMMQTETTQQPPNTVVDELQKGYLIHERLLRPALVTVSKHPAGDETNDETITK